MRYLLFFMLLVGIFVLGNRTCHGFYFGGGIRGEGPTVTENRTPGDFQGIALSLPADAEVSIGPTTAVEVQAQQNLMSILKTEVRDGVLHLEFDDNVSDANDLRVRITLPYLDELTVGGSGSIKVITPWKSEKPSLAVGGSGNIDVSWLEGGFLEASIGGSGNIDLKGKVNEADLTVSGSGELRAADLDMTTCKVQVSGSGSVDCGEISESLDVSVSGSGDVRYEGRPSVRQSVSGSGSVRQR